MPTLCADRAQGLSNRLGESPALIKTACGRTGRDFMKNIYDDFSIVTDFENLYRAHQSCRKGKRWKDSVAIYDIRGLECTMVLKDLLTSGRYRLSPYNCFTINERGKKRDIKSIKYRDRVVQKSLMDNVLTPLVVPTFIDANCASIKDKGTDYALKKLREHMSAQWRSKKQGYVLMCDMKGYFDSIPHKLLNDFYDSKLEDKYLRGLIHHIHASIPGGVGVPLGNQLSQLDALLALSPLDHEIKERMHIKYYGRYMDDFYLIHEDREYLKKCLFRIREFVEEREMRLNEKKTKIVTMQQGVDFLGFHFYMTDSGRVVQRLARKSIIHHKGKLKKMKKLLDEGKITFEACLEAHNGWKAHAKRGDTYYLLKAMDKRFSDMFKDYINKEEKNGKAT